MHTTTQEPPRFEGFMRLSELRELGYTRRRMESLLKAGKLERYAWGIYRHTDTPLSDYADFELATTMYPQAVISLVSALDFYGLTEHIPSAVDLVIPTGARAYSPQYPPIRVFRMDRSRLQIGTCRITVAPRRTIRMADPSRALADVFYYRNRCGEDVFIDALHRYAESEHYQPGLLHQYAEKLGTLASFQPYLRTIT